MQKNTAKDTFFSTNKSLNCRGKLLSLSTPKVMGILNITEDSFYDGGNYIEVEKALEHASHMIEQGADIIDIGAASSRPGAVISDPQTELERLVPVVMELRKNHPDMILSIDTYFSEVAEEMVASYGVDMINDISAGELDKEMIPLLCRLKVPYILMHMQGTPANMQEQPHYENITDELIQYFSYKIHDLYSQGMNDVLLDPGFGFGKTMEHNYELMANLSTFRLFELPIVAGVSRKSMIYNLLDSDSSQALNGTTAANMMLLDKGVNILRVHDVKEAKEVVAIYCEANKER